MEKTSQPQKRCRHPHQTDFPSRIPRSQKPHNSKGFCEDNLPQQMAEQNSQGRGMGDTASSSNPRPSRAVIRFLFAYNYQLCITHNRQKCRTCSLNTGIIHSSKNHYSLKMVAATVSPFSYLLDYYLVKIVITVSPFSTDTHRVPFA